MNEAIMEAYTEIDAILELMDEKDVEQVPIKLREYFKANKSKEYVKELRIDYPLEKQNLKEETLNILAVLHYNYWCKDEQKKKQLIEQYTENEKKYQEKLKQEYDCENLFKNKEQYDKPISEVAKDEVTMVEYKKSILLQIKNWFKRIMNKFK